MPAVVRIGDGLTTGHLCDTTSTLSGSNTKPSVFANGIPMCVPGAPVAPHTILDGEVCVPHSAVLNEGSPNVFTESKPQGRVGDSADGGNMTDGSPNVFANGS